MYDPRLVNSKLPGSSEVSIRIESHTHTRIYTLIYTHTNIHMDINTNIHAQL